MFKISWDSTSNCRLTWRGGSNEVSSDQLSLIRLRAAGIVHKNLHLRNILASLGSST